jgi:hypothetical protein
MRLSFRGLWLLSLLAISLLFSLTIWLFFHSQVPSTVTRLDSLQDAENEPDPFFTLTPRGMRRCYASHHDSSTSIGFLFLDSFPSDSNQTVVDRVRSNLLYSLRRSGSNPFIRILRPSSPLSSMEESLSLLLHFLHTSHLPPNKPLLISTSIEVLLLSSPNHLQNTFVSLNHKLVLSKDSPSSFALGTVEELVRFFGPIVSSASRNQVSNRGRESERMKKLIEERYLKLSQKTSGRVMIDHDSLLLATQSSSSLSTAPSSHLVQITALVPSLPLSTPAAVPTASSTRAYNSYLDTSLPPLPRISPHRHHSYDHFLAHRSQYRVVMTLTTLPHRLPHLAPVLLSLLHQHIRPDQVYLNLPTSYRRTFNSTASPGALSAQQIPNEILQLALNDPVLKIRLLTTDHGPATKLFPTLEEENDPSTLIVTVDDDMVYKPTQLQLLLTAYFRYPHAAYGHAGQLIDDDSRWGQGHQTRGRREKEFVVRTAWRWKVSPS